MITTAIDILLILIFGTLVYTWLIYPSLLFLLHALTQRHQKPTDNTPKTNDLKTAVIIAAYNEAAHIAERIENFIANDRADGNTTLFIGTDGCTDETAALAREAARNKPNVVVIEYPTNRGKASVLRDLVAAASAQSPPPDILIFSDANTSFAPNAIPQFLNHFSDPTIGGVCGRLRFKTQAASDEKPYWQFETILKQAESKLDSCLGANGAIYAIRRECFWQQLPPSTIVDDFVIGMKVREQGLRMIYDAAAVADEVLPPQQAEWTRRVRIGAGDFQALRFCWRCLLPAYGKFAWIFCSHKVLRWFTPHLALLALILATASLTHPSGHLVNIAAILTWLAATTLATGWLVSRLLPHLPPPLRPLSLIEHFVTMQAALLAGFFRFCRGNLAGTWTRTPRNTQQNTPTQPSTNQPKHIIAVPLIIVLIILCGPMATLLQHRNAVLPETITPDAIYLVCGARAQHRRIAAMTNWLSQAKQTPAHILIGNDTQNSLWSRRHQRNLTRAEWAQEALTNWLRNTNNRSTITIVPGTFANTDKEMQALAAFLDDNPDIQSIALVTSRFHARRTLQRFNRYAPGHVHPYLIAGIPYWKNRAPWVVTLEWIKILRDHFGLTQHPLLSRQSI